MENDLKQFKYLLSKLPSSDKYPGGFVLKSNIISLCAWCESNILTQQEKDQLEMLSEKLNIQLSHGICENCAKSL